MEPKFQTSFIPKKPIVSHGSSSVGVLHDTNIFSVIASVVFILSLLASGALFAYKRVLLSQISQYDKDIVAAIAALQPQKIQELIDANSRITATRTLLENHVVLSKLLLLLNDLTLKKMRFIDLSYINKNKESNLSILAELQTYNALAEQQNIFINNEFIKNPEFSDFVLGDNGYITVKFSATVDPMLVSYKKAMESTPTN